MDGSLGTTNVMLGIMAAVSVLEALVVLGIAVVGWRLYSKATATIAELEEKQIKPMAAKVDAILSDVQRLTARLEQRAARVDRSIDDTVDGVSSKVRDTAHSVTDTLRGLRDALANALSH